MNANAAVTPTPSISPRIKLDLLEKAMENLVSARGTLSILGYVETDEVFDKIQTAISSLRSDIRFAKRLIR